MHDEPPPKGFDGEHWHDEDTGDNYYRTSNGHYEIRGADGAYKGNYGEIRELELRRGNVSASTKVNQSLEAVGGLVDFQEGLLKGTTGTTVLSYSKVLNKVGTAVNIGQGIVGGIEIHNAYVRAGGSINYNVQRTFARVAGGFAGGVYGVEIGASAGFLLGGPVGAAFGAVIGGAFYGYVGEKVGSGVVSIYHALK